MKVIVLAAGRGTRLRPLTDDRPKCLVPLRGRPLLAYQLEAFRAAGLRDVTLVTGYRAALLARYGRRRVLNRAYATTNMVYSLFRAEDVLLSGEDVLVSYGDIVFEARVLAALLRARGDLPVVVDQGWRELWSFRMDDPLADAETLKLDGRGRIVEIGRRAARYEDIEGQYIGLVRISARVAREVCRCYHALDAATRRRTDMTGFLDRLAGRLRLEAVPVRHGWLEVDTVEDWRRYEGGGLGRLFRFPALAGRAPAAPAPRAKA
jgi:L-glutamine-phosphate cytidylyltransferase